MVHTKMGTLFVRLGDRDIWIGSLKCLSSACDPNLSDLLRQLSGLVCVSFGPVGVLLTQILLDQRVQECRHRVLSAR